MTWVMVDAPALPLPHTEVLTRPAPEAMLRCRRCDHGVAPPSARVARAGAHVHTRINPGGWVHSFGCFAEAPGCVPVGPATTEHTWFAGYAWRVALCGGCGEHLGWRFEGAGDAFWGLILERLREA